LIPLGIVIIVLCFYLLGSTADNYLSPALETIAVKLGISESLAGVTFGRGSIGETIAFLAFGNGAPDVLGALSASGGGEDGTYLALGALLGAGLFVS
jgi:sodium/potassium/calcium exchanger 6